MKQGPLCLLFVVLSVLLAPLTFAQEAPPPAVEVTHITGNLHKLYINDQAAVIASIGEDGLLLVDAAYAFTTDAVQEALDEFKAGPAKLITNTHGDLDHVGGNAALGESARIIAHPTVRAAMSRYYSLPAVDIAGLPDITVTDETTIYFNDETIKVIPIPGGHTRGDVLVHFLDSEVLCLGDIVLSGAFPNADPGRGGDAQRLLKVLKKLHSEMPRDTRLIPSHGVEIDFDGLQDYIDLLEDTMAAVQKEIDAGLDLEQIIAAKPLEPWAKWESLDWSPTAENWAREIYASLAGGHEDSINIPLTAAIVNDGIVPAIDTYRRLKKEEPDAWNFAENQLNFLGYQLLQRDMVDAAIAIFKLNVEMFPAAFNTYDSLGEACLAAGKTDLAISNYERSLELNPENDNAVTVLQGLKTD